MSTRHPEGAAEDGLRSIRSLDQIGRSFNLKLSNVIGSKGFVVQDLVLSDLLLCLTGRELYEW